MIKGKVRAIMMKRRKIRIQCKCRACGKVWMDRRQANICEDCDEFNEKTTTMKNGWRKSGQRCAQN